MPVGDQAVMQAMKRQNGGGNTPLAANTPPMTAPMATPEPKSGAIQHAKVKIGQALDLLEQSLPDLGSETEDGQAAVAAMKALHKILGQKRAEIDALQPTEARNLLQSLPHGGGAPPGVGAMASAPPVPGMAPPPGGAGGAGAPPPAAGTPPSLPGAM